MKTKKAGKLHDECGHPENYLNGSCPSHPTAQPTPAAPTHSETPWKVLDNMIQAYDGEFVVTADGVCDETKHAINAAFIVRAVNAHEELVVALKQAQLALQHWGNKAESYEKANDPVRLAAHGAVSQALARAEQGR